MVFHVKADLTSEVGSPVNLNTILRAPCMCSHLFVVFALPERENWTVLGNDFWTSFLRAPQSVFMSASPKEYKNIGLVWETTT